MPLWPLGGRPEGTHILHPGSQHTHEDVLTFAAKQKQEAGIHARTMVRNTLMVDANFMVERVRGQKHLLESSDQL